MNGQFRRDQWTLGKVAAAGFIALFLAIQLTVPVVMLAVRGVGPEQPQSGELPMSWQMYTVVPPVGDLVITMSDGSTAKFDAVEALGVIGSRMAYDPDVLKAACRIDAGATGVSITIVGRERSARC